MIIDSSTIPRGDIIQSDICIVGAGMAGMILARELSGRGIRICLIESGGWDHEESTQALYQGDNTGYPYYPLDLVRERRYGGSTMRWGIDLGNGREGVRMRSLDAIDFEERPGIPHSGWPFGKDTLDPYYQRAHQLCGMGPYSYAPEDWEQAGQTERLPIDETKVETTLFQFGRVELFQNDYRKAIEASDDITLLLHANVLEIETDPNSQQVQQLSVGNHDGAQFQLQARTFILANGGIEIPRLLMLSNRHAPAGLGNAHDLVGRFFMEHPHLLSGRFVPSDPETFEKTGLYEIHTVNDISVLGYLKLNESVLREEQLPNYCVCLWPTDSHEPVSRKNYLYSKAYNSIRQIRNDLRAHNLPSEWSKHLRNFATDSNELITHLFNKLGPKKDHGATRAPVAYQLHHMCEQVPNPDSRITLSEQHDALGQRTAICNWQLSAGDIRGIQRAQEIIDQALQKAGLGHLEIETFKTLPPAGITGGLHHMGTTRMHKDPKQGVVDANCKVHGISNLYIASSSVFPTSGFANPSLTIAALTIRLADHLEQVLV